MILTGTLVNSAAIVAGSLAGVLIGKFIPERFSDAVEKGAALCVLYIGVDGMLAGEKTLVAQCRAGAGGTWDGTTENLRRGWSPVFVSDDGSEGAQALIARGAVPVRTLSGLDDLQPAQLQF